MINFKKINFKKINLYFYKFEYEILDLAGILSGLLIIYIANNYFLDSSIYFLLFGLGILVGFLGFLLEYAIKLNKRKVLENEFSYFLKNLSREYKNVDNLSYALYNVSQTNYFGNINQEIKRIADRVSWGDSFENALKSINEPIKSKVIDHTLILLKVFEKSEIPYYKVLKNISKDINVYKSEVQKKKYFKNLFNLSIVFFIIFLLVLLYLDFLFGNQFLWYSSREFMTRIFFDNFLLFISIVLSFFTTFVIYSIKSDKPVDFLKYIFIFFIIVVIMFQVFIPKPEAQEVLIDTINHLDDSKRDSDFLEQVIALKSLSSKSITEQTDVSMIYFIDLDDKSCEGEECLKYIINVEDAMFFDFDVRLNNEIAYVYYKQR